MARDGIGETWGAQAVADLLGRLCQWNQANPTDPVAFFGFNNYQPWDDGPALISFAQQFMPAEATALATIFQTIWGLRHAGKKVALATHNLHLNRHSDIVETVYPAEPAAAGAFENSVRFGQHLDESLGADFLPIGMIAYRSNMKGNPVAVTPGDIVVPTGHPIVESVLHGFETDNLLVDLESVTVAGGLFEPGEPYGFFIPFDYNIAAILEAPPLSVFGALIYLEDSPAWQPL